MNAGSSQMTTSWQDPRARAWAGAFHSSEALPGEREARHGLLGAVTAHRFEGSGFSLGGTVKAISAPVSTHLPPAHRSRPSLPPVC